MKLQKFDQYYQIIVKKTFPDKTRQRLHGKVNYVVETTSAFGFLFVANIMDKVRLGNIDRLWLKVLLDFEKNNSVTLMSRPEKLSMNFFFTVEKNETTLDAYFQKEDLIICLLF